MTDNKIPAELWIIDHGGEWDVHTADTALIRLAELSYEGALPGTNVERWEWDGAWVRDCPWEASAENGDA